jgi:hypothetical protein
MKKALSIAHMMVASTITTLFLFQMATLMACISAYFGENTKGRRRTYEA